MTKRLVLMLLLVLLLGIAGCGQKGPLYLPDPPAETEEEDEAAR